MIGMKWIAWSAAGVVAVTIPTLALALPSRHPAPIPTAPHALELPAPPPVAQANLAGATPHVAGYGRSSHKSTAATKHQSSGHAKAAPASRKPRATKPKHKAAPAQTAPLAHSTRSTHTVSTARSAAATHH